MRGLVGYIHGETTVRILGDRRAELVTPRRQCKELGLDPTPIRRTQGTVDEWHEFTVVVATAPDARALGGLLGVHVVAIPEHRTVGS